MIESKQFLGPADPEAAMAGVVPDKIDEASVQVADMSLNEAVGVMHDTPPLPEEPEHPLETLESCLARISSNERYIGWVASGMRNVDSSYGDASDVVQEAVARAWKSKVEPNAAHSYVQAAARTIIIDMVRRQNAARGHRVRVEFDETVKDVPYAGEDDFDSMLSDRTEVMSAIRKLAPGQREIVIRRFYRDLNDQQIAAEMGISVSSVKHNGSRAARNLRRILAGYVDANGGA